MIVFPGARGVLFQRGKGAATEKHAVDEFENLELPGYDVAVSKITIA